MIEELYKLREARPQKHANKVNKAVRRRSKDTVSHSAHYFLLMLDLSKATELVRGDNVEETAHIGTADFLFYLDQHKT